MGVVSNFWGPHLWIFLHSVSMNYSDKPSSLEITNMFNFIISLENIIPCKICRGHYSKLIREGAKGIPPLSINVLNNRKTFVKYIYDIHNYINKFKPLEGNQIRFEPPSLKSVALFYNSKLSVGSKKLNI